MAQGAEFVGLFFHSEFELDIFFYHICLNDGVFAHYVEVLEFHSRE